VTSLDYLTMLRADRDEWRGWCEAARADVEHLRERNALLEQVIRDIRRETERQP